MVIRELFVLFGRDMNHISPPAFFFPAHTTRTHVLHQYQAKQALAHTYINPAKGEPSQAGVAGTSNPTSDHLVKQTCIPPGQWLFLSSTTWIPMDDR